jgi:hypothetical protein
MDQSLLKVQTRNSKRNHRIPRQSSKYEAHNSSFIGQIKNDKRNLYLSEEKDSGIWLS